MDQDNTTWTVARTPGVIRETVCTVVHQRTASLDSERGTDEGSEVHAGRRQTVRRELNSQSTGRPRLKYRPSSRTGENPLSGMIGGTMETAASFEARFAPSSFLTTPNRPCREIWCRRRESNDTRLLILCNLLQTYERKNHTNLCMPASYV